MPAKQNATKNASPRRSARTPRQALTATRLVRQKKSTRSNPAIRATARPSKRSRDKANLSCPIVGIGGSAGGFEAAMDLLRHLPPKTGMAFVIVQHLDPHHGSRLPNLLGKATSMPVTEVTGTITPQPNAVYVQPPNKCVIAKNGKLTLVSRTERLNIAIDHFFESLAEECGSRGIGIVLSGTGSDGTAGLRAIKAAGGLTFAQTEESAKFDAMPRSAIRSGFVDLVLPPDAIAREIRRIADHPYLRRPLIDTEAAEKDLEIVIERPDGERRHVIPAPQILKDSRGKTIGAINCLYDVTERERAQERLRQAMEFDETVMTNMGEGLYTVDAEGSVTTMNPAAEKLFGWSFNELRGKKMHDVTHYKHRDGSPFPAHECPGLHVLRKGKSLTNCEDVFIRKDGTFFDVLYSSSPIRKGNEITGLVVVFRDITEQKRAEAAAMRLAALVRSSRDAVVAKDLNGIITDWNQSAQRIFGYKPKEIIGKSILTLIPRERQFEESEILRRIRGGESIDHYETIRRRKDGRLIDVSLTISPIKDLQGKVVGVSKIARDITGRKTAERRLAEQAHLLDLSNDAILVRDASDRIVYWNRGATEVYGYSNKEAEGKVSHELLRTEHPELLKNIYGKLRRDNRWSGELVHTRKDGTKITVSSRWALDCDARGKPMSVLETNTNITARKRAELELQRSKGALEQVVEQRTRELRVANAELESEIQRRKGLEGEILSVSDREQQRLGQELHDGLCQHLTAVAFMTRSIALRLRNHRVIDAADIEKVAELVNTAAVDTRNLSRALHRVDVDAAGLIIALQDLVDREIWRTPCRLEMKPSFQINDDTAATHLYRIAREAVINANKHAQARQIVVRLERVRKKMILRVIDDGIGFPEDLKPQQGLGYHIMKYRAQLMGGRLEIDSPQTGGTRVSCYLPIRVSPSRNAKNGEHMAGDMRNNSNPPVASDLTLRHLRRQGAANA